MRSTRCSRRPASTTTRLSAPNTTTDYSAYVTKVPSDADIVFFPTQKPGDAQTFAQQLLEQGKKAKVFGGDGSNDPSQFKVPGSYVSNFAAPINLFAYNKPIIAGWMKDNPGKTAGLVRAADLRRDPDHAAGDQADLCAATTA